MSDKQNGKLFGAFFISDQRPMYNEISFWLKFMNQETPVMIGTEKIARRTGASVVYIEIEGIRRGYYRLNLELITSEPEKTSEGEITRAFYKKLEESIQRKPEQYFWTHKRWKFKKEVN